jgi:hypothetical protein
MSGSVTADGRPIVHQGSGYRSTAFPDVCKTPTSGAPVPVPYLNVGHSADAARGPLTVRCEGRMPMVRGAIYTRSRGDEVGKLGGVLSKTTRGRCEFALYSFDVTFEGRGVCRRGDPLFHNRRNACG